MTSSRRTAAIVGLLFLIATVSFSAGDTLIKGVLDRPDHLIGASGDATALAAGALLAFVDGLAVVGIAVLMFPFLRHTSESLALGYVGLRVAELGVVLLYMVAPLIVLALGNGARDGTVDASASQSRRESSSPSCCIDRSWSRARWQSLGSSAIRCCSREPS